MAIFAVVVDGREEEKTYDTMRGAAMRVKELKNDHDAYFRRFVEV